MEIPASDPKAGERTYYARLGEAGLAHARAKPFSDEECGRHLSNFGAVLQLIGKPPQRILDCGCGTGWTSLFLARAGHHVTGLDISAQAVAIAREMAADAQLANVDFVAEDYEAFSASDAFDVVLFYDALHHAEDESAALRVAYRALKKGGLLLAIEPGEGHGASEGAKHAVATYGVHEKDMPPKKAWAIGKQIGFRQKLFLPYPHEWSRAAFRKDFRGTSSTMALLGERIWGFFRAATMIMRARRAGMLLMWK
ncbi:MAG TPA: class I SAM-dependent methyltransferase [Opitutaceae bacterium]|nr:class I SAM-dependent methyltransferase [Opitutaceae bacterium]